MLIVCPPCATSYGVKLASLGSPGRPVRCSRCCTVWRAELSRADRLVAAAAAGEDGPSYHGPNAPAELEAPPMMPVDLDVGRAPIEIRFGHPSAQQQDIETAAARRQRRAARRRSAAWPLSRLQSGILALIIVDGFVRILPQTASFYASMGLPVNLRSLTFDGISTSTEQREGALILVVEGNIVNATAKIVDVPRLKLLVRNAERQEIYSWTAISDRTVLPAGEVLSFHTRLASPPAEGRDACASSAAAT